MTVIQTEGRNHVGLEEDLKLRWEGSGAGAWVAAWGGPGQKAQSALPGHWAHKNYEIIDVCGFQPPSLWESAMQQ